MSQPGCQTCKVACTQYWTDVNPKENVRPFFLFFFPILGVDSASWLTEQLNKKVQSSRVHGFLEKPRGSSHVSKLQDRIG